MSDEAGNKPLRSKLLVWIIYAPFTLLLLLWLAIEMAVEWCGSGGGICGAWLVGLARTTGRRQGNGRRLSSHGSRAGSKVERLLGSAYPVTVPELNPPRLLRCRYNVLAGPITCAA
jgi:hypothetical protein